MADDQSHEHTAKALDEVANANAQIMAAFAEFLVRTHVVSKDVLLAHLKALTDPTASKIGPAGQRSLDAFHSAPDAVFAPWPLCPTDVLTRLRSAPSEPP